MQQANSEVNQKSLEIEMIMQESERIQQEAVEQTQAQSTKLKSLKQMYKCQSTKLQTALDYLEQYRQKEKEQIQS